MFGVGALSALCTPFPTIGPFSAKIAVMGLLEGGLVVNARAEEEESPLGASLRAVRGFTGPDLRDLCDLAELDIPTLHSHDRTLA